MKIYVDDIRNAPDESWTVIRDPLMAIWVIQSYGEEIEHLSLDHDLAFKDVFGTEIDGLDIVKAMQKLAAERSFYNMGLPRKVTVHSQNPVGAKAMNDRLDILRREGYIE